MNLILTLLAAILPQLVLAAPPVTPSSPAAALCALKLSSVITVQADAPRQFYTTALHGNDMLAINLGNGDLSVRQIDAPVEGISNRLRMHEVPVSLPELASGRSVLIQSAGLIGEFTVVVEDPVTHAERIRVLVQISPTPLHHTSIIDDKHSALRHSDLRDIPLMTEEAFDNLDPMVRGPQFGAYLGRVVDYELYRVDGQLQIFVKGRLLQAVRAALRSNAGRLQNLKDLAAQMEFASISIARELNWPLADFETARAKFFQEIGYKPHEPRIGVRGALPDPANQSYVADVRGNVYVAYRDKLRQPLRQAVEAAVASQSDARFTVKITLQEAHPGELRNRTEEQAMDDIAYLLTNTCGLEVSTIDVGQRQFIATGDAIAVLRATVMSGVVDISEGP